MLGGNVGMKGDLHVRHTTQKVDWRWRLRNTLRWTFIWGWLITHLARAFSRITGVITITSELSIRVRKGREWIDYGVVSYLLVTDAGVAFLVDDWDANGQDITTMNYHGCGTGSTAESAGDTALVTESTTALDPNSTRATGTRSQPTANQYRTTGTLTFDGSAAIVEHGLLSQQATGGGTLWDRSVFSAINVSSGDSIQFQYTCTLTSGG